MTKYKVAFHCGSELTLKTKVEKGEAWVDGDGLHIESPAAQLVIPIADLVSSDLFRLHGLGRVIRLETRTGRIFLTVVRLMIGQFAFINFLKTGSLHKRLSHLGKPI
jgi:hypothetical protein